MTACGLGRRTPEGSVANPTFRAQAVKGGDGRREVVVDNVAWCGGARCPRCAPLVGGRLSERVSEVLVAIRERGCEAAMVTLTAGHDLRTRLVDARKVMQGAISAMQRSARWERLQRRGLIGFVRTFESPWNPGTGWHLHVHGWAIVDPVVAAKAAEEEGAKARAAVEVARECLGQALDAGASAAVIERRTLRVARLEADAEEAARVLTAEEAGGVIVARWIELLGKAGWTALPVGQTVEPVRLGDDDIKRMADYPGKALASWDAASELAGGDAKGGRRADARTPLQLLAEGAAGDVARGHLYVEAVLALRGQRLFVVGPRVSAALGLGDAELDDEEEIEVEAQEGEVLGSLSATLWMDAARRRLRRRVIEVIEDHCLVRRLSWNETFEAIRTLVGSSPLPPPYPPPPTGARRGKSAPRRPL